MTDNEIIAIRKASRTENPMKSWGETLAFARALIAALAERGDMPHSHQCGRCRKEYTPVGSDEDCPSCGYDGMGEP
jgi:hypothetical protein